MGARAASPDTEYWIDAQDRLVWVSDSWVDFAIANEAPDFAERRIVGQPLWGFVEGQELQALYRGIAERLRRIGASVSLPFRCDAPDVARHMVLHMAGQPDGSIRFRAEVLEEHGRRPVPVLDARRPRSDETLVICSQCKRIRRDEDSWEELEHASSALGLMTLETMPRLSHGLCDPCARAFSVSVDRD